MKSWKATLAVLAVAAGVTTAGIVGAAQASAAPGDCSLGNQCVYLDAEYGTGPIIFYGGTKYVGDGVNDKISSISNNRGIQIFNFEHSDWRGYFFTAVPKGGTNSGKYSNLVYVGYNDRISSHS